MRWIQKNKSPENFENWKMQENATSWSQLPGSIPKDGSDNYFYYSKNELRAALLKEQNSKCLYCEGCISNHPSKTRVDHVKTPQSDTSSAEHLFDYNNLGVSCNSEYLHQESEIRKYRNVTYCDPEDISMEDEADNDVPKTHPTARHCDAHKEDKILPFTPYDQSCEEKLEFSKDGSVSSEDSDGVKVIEVLNLNAASLRNRREGAIAGFINDGDKELVKEEEAKILYEILVKRKSLKYSKAILDSLKRLY